MNEPKYIKIAIDVEDGDFVTHFERDNKEFLTKYYNLKEENILLKTKINEVLSLIQENKKYWEEMHYDGCGVDDAIDKIINIIISR